MSQELRLDFNPAGKAGQCSIRADDAMTRHDDRQRILAIGGADCADGLGRPDALSQIQIAPGLTERNFSQRPPDLLLKFCPSQLKRKMELVPCAGEILL